MKKLFSLFLLLFNCLLGRLHGAADKESPVMAGLDAIVKLEGKTIGYATNVNIDEDFELQGRA